MFTPIEMILGNLGEMAGMRVSISGNLCVSAGRETFLAKNCHAFGRGERLKVIDGEPIYTHLMATLPPYGGGELIYDEEAYVTGTISDGALMEVTSCRVVRGNREVLVPLAASDNGPS